MEGQFFGGAGMAPSPSPQQGPVQQSQQPFGSIPPPLHFQYGYVPQQFPPPPPPYIPAAAPAAAAPPPPPPPVTHGGFFNPWEMPPTPVPPPQDPELHKRIDKLVEFYVKNGPGFEALMKEKQKQNPDYAFLFGADGHSYYQYKLWITINPHLVAFNPALNMVNQAIGLPAGMNPAPPPPPMPPSAAPPAFPQFFDLAAAAAAAAPPAPAPPPPPMHLPQQQMFDPALASATAQLISSEMVAELRGLLENLSGTKESIKNARNWFVQRSAFAPALVEVLRERVAASENNVDRQMHVLYLINDILFSSLQSRHNTKDPDGISLAFRPVLSSILVTIYENPRLDDADREQVEKMLQFWGSKEIFDPDTVYSLEKAMRLDSRHRERSLSLSTPEPERKEDQHHLQQNAAGSSQNQSVAALFPALAPFLQQQQHQTPSRSDQPPYPFFPPGLIPGMVRKMQIGSGVPYSPLSPLDIPTIIPPAAKSESYVMDRVSKFFKEIGEPDPLAGKYKPSEDTDEEESEAAGGARIPPPPQMQQVDPQTGTLPDGSMEHRPGMSSTGRLGLGAAADPNEATQYDDVYTSYRKQRSSNYHTSLSARAAAR